MSAMHVAAVVIQRAWRTNWLRHARPAASAAAAAERERSRGSGPRIYLSAEAASAVPGLTQGEGRTFFALEPARRAAARGGEVARTLRERYAGLLRIQLDREMVMQGSEVGLPPEKQPQMYSTFGDYCAAIIQGRWRSTRALRLRRIVATYGQFNLYHVAAFEIQQAWRESKRRLAEKATAEESWQQQEISAFVNAQLKAVLVVQRTWRRDQARRQYEALKDTIAAFDRSGDPCLLLRQILPSESMLLDSAMQVHVRFRLGGTRFPPSIYYKVYTHGAVVDLGAFAPRDYVAERIGLSKGPCYQRAENNGWRLMYPRLVPTGLKVVDEVEKATRKPLKNFHFSRLKRREDLERARRKRTVEWMRKLYGLATPRVDELEDAGGNDDAGSYAAGPPSARGGAARALMPAAHNATQPLRPRPPSSGPPSSRAPRPRSLSGSGSILSGIDQPPAVGQDDLLRPAGRPVRQLLVTPVGEGPQGGFFNRDVIYDEPTGFGEFDVNDDELLEWSRKLDFDAYVDGWQRIATSNDSEGTLMANKRRSAAMPTFAAVH